MQSKNVLLYTGQYTGTGTYGVNNPTSITFPFAPILITSPTYQGNNYSTAVFNTNILTTSYTQNYFTLSSNVMMKKSADGKTITWYSRSSSSSSQLNDINTVYKYVAIGGYDMGKV